MTFKRTVAGWSWGDELMVVFDDGQRRNRKESGRQRHAQLLAISIRSMLETRMIRMKGTTDSDTKGGIKRDSSCEKTGFAHGTTDIIVKMITDGYDGF